MKARLQRNINTFALKPSSRDCCTSRIYFTGNSEDPLLNGSIIHAFSLQDFVVFLLDAFYADRHYARFYVLETIARVPYFCKSPFGSISFVSMYGATSRSAVDMLTPNSHLERIVADAASTSCSPGACAVGAIVLA
jgi:hypothetical protein